MRIRVPVHPDESEASLSERVRSGEYLIYPRAIGWIADGRVELEGDAIRFDGRILDGPEVVNET
jgi:folate-dependent phosphoribosylglycinamide formyltransferase PurN